MIEKMESSTRFTPLQQEMLNLFARKATDEDLLAIKDLIGKYYFSKLQRKVTTAAEQMGYTQEDFDAWLNDPNQ